MVECKIVGFIVFFTFYPVFCFAQLHYRIAADVKIAILDSCNNVTLNYCRTYYDKNVARLFNYSLDGCLKEVVDDKEAVEKSIWFFVVNDDFENFAKPNRPLEYNKIETDSCRAVVYYSVPNNVLDTLQNKEVAVCQMVCCKSKNHVDALLCYNGFGQPLMKQYFQKYIIVENAVLPTVIYQIFYKNNRENLYIKTSISNIVVDEIDNNSFYFGDSIKCSSTTY